MKTLGPYELGPEGKGLYVGDSKILSLDIPDESIDFIICDPVYQNIEDYTWLAKTAARVLKPNSACLAFCSNTKHRETREAMDDHLDFVMPLNFVVVGKTMRLFKYHAFVWTTPCLWYQKGDAVPDPWICDTYMASQARANNRHKWAKGSGVITRWMECFTNPGDIVFDPFAGGGTVPYIASQMRRDWLGFEIDPETALEAREHIKSYQQSLIPIIESVQANMFDVVQEGEEDVT